MEDRLVASAALIHLGAPGGVEKMMSTLDGAVAENRNLPAIAGTILRTLTDAAVLDGMRKLLFKPAGDVLGSLLLPLLAQQGVLSSEQLLQFVSHPSDDFAVPAVEALAWFGDAELAPHIWKMLKAAPVDCCVRFGAPLAFDAAADRKTIAQQPENRVRELAEGFNDPGN